MQRALLILCLAAITLPVPAGAGLTELPAPGGTLLPGTAVGRPTNLSPDAGGKYEGRLHVIYAPEDRETYGAYRDWGYWSGTAYHGVDHLSPGYWVYAYPNWYVWKARREDYPTEPPVRIVPEKRPWGPEQAAGEPDTLEAGDLATAWASRFQDDQDEWLELTYAQAVIPSAVLVHETYNPGALVRVTARADDGREVTVWTGHDSLEPNSGRGVAIIPFRTDFKVTRVRLYLDSKNVPGWNEIDAVGLVDEFGRTQWAAGAEASSTYAESAGPQAPERRYRLR